MFNKGMVTVEFKTRSLAAEAIKSINASLNLHAEWARC
jgi:hypothetical protein